MNNREIKFRARTLDGDTKDGWVYSTDHGLSDFWLGVEEGRYDEDTVGQYTGIKDNNGKEICEGDLINEPEEYGGILDPWKVIWEDNAFFGLEGYDYEAQLEWDTFEVIGNIYENPELLKESKK